MSYRNFTYLPGTYVRSGYSLYSKVLILHTYILEERAMCKLQVVKPKGHKFT